MSSWNTYPSIFNLGHAALAELFLDPVVMEEKIDGSQFSFGIIDGVLRFRSKRQEIHLVDGKVPAGARMFEAGVHAVIDREKLLKPEWTYRGEFLHSAKHNTLAYDRPPSEGVAIFDINTGEEAYLDPTSKRLEAQRIGFECVPVLFSGYVTDPIGIVQGLLDRPSILGGQKIEGVVIKNYARFGKDHKVLMAKYVSEAFKEVHRGDWRQRNPGQADFIGQLGDQYRTPARWAKAVQHLRESGRLEGSPRDIGALIKEIPEDILKEHGEEIRTQLFDHFWPKLRRYMVSGVAEYYKIELARAQEAPLTEVDMADPRPRLLPEMAAA